MSKKTKKGKLCLVWVGVPGSISPQPIVDPAVVINPGGVYLPFFSSIANEPTDLRRIVSATSFKLNKEKNEEQRHYLGGSDIGETIQANSQVMGSIVMDKISNDDDYRLDPGLELFTASADIENSFLYIRSATPFGINPLRSNSYIWEVKSAIVSIKGDVSNDAQSITVPETFNLKGSGLYEHGYMENLI
jgi:hypothetical protein